VEIKTLEEIMINIVYLNCFNLSLLFIFTKEWLRLKHLKNTWMDGDNHSGYLLWNFQWLVNVVFFDAVICWVSYLLVVFGFLFLVAGEFFVLLELLVIYSCYTWSKPFVYLTMRVPFSIFVKFW